MRASRMRRRVRHQGLEPNRTYRTSHPCKARIIRTTSQLMQRGLRDLAKLVACGQLLALHASSPMPSNPRAATHGE